MVSSILILTNYQQCLLCRYNPIFELPPCKGLKLLLKSPMPATLTHISISSCLFTLQFRFVALPASLISHYTPASMNVQGWDMLFWIHKSHWRGANQRKSVMGPIPPLYPHKTAEQLLPRISTHGVKQDLSIHKNLRSSCYCGFLAHQQKIADSRDRAKRWRREEKALK